MTVLMIAAESGSLEVVQWLVDVKKADITDTDWVSNSSVDMFAEEVFKISDRDFVA